MVGLGLLFECHFVLLMQIRFVFCDHSVDDMSPVKIEVTDVTAADSNKDKEEGL